ncbi:MAG: methyltransferase domain-containing protein [Chitinophagaceae bacterium]|nr:MAG: methyltransferase domain-containing protein [Chitinophagaceae bacterium]
MNSNERLIHKFYTCFKNKDFKGMQDCYADEATFNDAIFKNLNAAEVKAMWQMLITKGKDLRLEFNAISTFEDTAKAHWDAYYTFSATGNKVINRIDATFKIENGKIVKHTDNFNFYAWAKQALGLTGWLLGWTSFLHKKVSAQAMKNLAHFMAVKDNFSNQSSKYAKFRPTYPKALYDFLFSQVDQKRNAWDAATGNGQVAIELSRQFEKVFATDISSKQLDEAPKLANVIYKVERAEHTAFDNNEFDLITVAQAIHWFNFEDFFREVRRLLKPNGVFAAFGYGLMKITPEIDAVVYQLYEAILGTYWDVERKHIENGYLSIPFPFEEIKSPTFEIIAEWNFDQLVGYLETWSSLQHYIRAHGNNPIDLVYTDLKRAWGDQHVKTVHFPIVLKVFKI